MKGKAVEQKAKSGHTEEDTRPVRWVGIDEAQQILPISSTTLWRLRKKGKLRAIHAGGRLLFDESSLNKYLANLDAQQNQ